MKDDNANTDARPICIAYGVILMDMQMPEMDGVTATETLRAAGYAGPIVALTANAFDPQVLPGELMVGL